MKNLLESWDTIVHTGSGKNIILFLDYDGTLAPIAENPWQAVLSVENKELIERLLKFSFYQVVIISGRMLADLKHMVGISGITYVGNHGWEIEGASIRFESVVPVDVAAAIKKIKYELITQFCDIQGAFVEDKGMTLSVHYRLVARDKEFLVKKIFDYICLPYLQKKMVTVSSGKKVLEIRPPVKWDKGKAAVWFLRKQEILKGRGNVLPIYIGDDRTDEEAFDALNNQGVTVLVGAPRPSSAQYYLAGPPEVTEFLKYILDGVYGIMPGK